jgi:MoxR-like ATPase
MMSTDIVGTHIFDPGTTSFKLTKGPIFSNILFIDEINRNTAKTNNAFIEAMQERQVTIEGETQPLPRPFMVIATQSPIEFHGVFPLPEVLVDRFTFGLRVDYPSIPEEIELIRRNSASEAKVKKAITDEQISYLIGLAKNVYVAPQIQSYIIDLVHRTREMESLSLGASPRVSMALARTSRARALIKGRQYVLPDDVKYLTPHVLRHRIILSAQARSQGLSAETVIKNLLEETPIPQKPSIPS